MSVFALCPSHVSQFLSRAVPCHSRYSFSSVFFALFGGLIYPSSGVAVTPVSVLRPALPFGSFLLVYDICP